jgi:hypothetical protein
MLRPSWARSQPKRDPRPNPSYNCRMPPDREIGRTLLIAAGLLAVIGAAFYFSSRLPFRPGRLPGDIVHRGERTTFYFPIVTCLVVSAALSLIFWLISQFRR